MTTTNSPRLRPQLIADAVIAGYIRDISARERAITPSRPSVRGVSTLRA